METKNEGESKDENYTVNYIWITQFIPIIFLVIVLLIPLPSYALLISSNFTFNMEYYPPLQYPYYCSSNSASYYQNMYKHFPPIKTHTYRVVITACGNEKEIPKFDPEQTTFTNCNVLGDCKEAPAYLDFLINWYDNLTEEVVVFVHGHAKSWHITNTEKAIYNAVNTSYFWEQPFGGFNEGVWKKNCDNVVYQELYSYYFDNTTMPRVWNRFSVYPCCATFFVRTEQIRMRPESDYINILNNLRKWMTINPGQSYYCSRLFEYTWHILLTGSNFILTPPGNITWMHNRQGNVCPFNRSDAS